MTMRFLADESCDFAVVRTLRRAGFDVLSVSESTPRAEDSEVIGLALREERILLTEDKDLGRLVYSHGQETLGVIFLRFPTFARKQISRDGWGLGVKAKQYTLVSWRSLVSSIVLQIGR
jgi:predicted nuclease of predicted toxin-antitoxin system